MSGGSPGEGRLERDRDGLQGLAHWAAGPRALCRLLELLGRHTGHDAGDLDDDAGDSGAGLERDVSSGVEGGRRLPGPARPPDRAIEKQEECAAAMSSSGLVRPSGSSARDAHVTLKVPMPEDCMVTWPAPSVRVPSQWEVAVRLVAIVVLLRVVGWVAWLRPLTDSRGGGRLER